MRCERRRFRPPSSCARTQASRKSACTSQRPRRARSRWCAIVSTTAFTPSLWSIRSTLCVSFRARDRAVCLTPWCCARARACLCVCSRCTMLVWMQRVQQMPDHQQVSVVEGSRRPVSVLDVGPHERPHRRRLHGRRVHDLLSVHTTQRADSRRVLRVRGVRSSFVNPRIRPTHARLSCRARLHTNLLLPSHVNVCFCVVRLRVVWCCVHAAECKARFATTTRSSPRRRHAGRRRRSAAKARSVRQQAIPYVVCVRVCRD